MIDLKWLYHVAVDEELVRGFHFEPKLRFSRSLSVSSRGRSPTVRWPGNRCRGHDLYCFAKREDADAFVGRFGGEHFDPKIRDTMGDRRQRYPRAGWLPRPKAALPRCAWPFFSAVVSPSGNVYACCNYRMDDNYLRPEAVRPMGSIHSRERTEDMSPNCPDAPISASAALLPQRPSAIANFIECVVKFQGNLSQLACPKVVFRRDRSKAPDVPAVSMRALNIAAFGISSAHHGTSHHRPSRSFVGAVLVGGDEGTDQSARRGCGQGEPMPRRTFASELEKAADQIADISPRRSADAASAACFALRNTQDLAPR